MLTDGQALYLTLVALYVIECATWVPRGAAAFVADGSARGSDARASLKFPLRFLSNNRGGVVFGRFFPRSVATFVVPQWPVSLAKEGVLAWVAESLEISERAHQTGSYRALSSIERVRADGRDVFVGADLFLTAVSPKLASRIAAAVDEIRALPAQKRQPAIDAHLASLFDVAAVRAKVADLFRATRWLGVASFTLAVIAFVFSPAAVIALGIEHVWPFVLGAVYLTTWLVASLFFRAHRRLSPDLRSDRIGHVILLALLPLSAMRASDAIARTALHGFHPLAVAAALAPRDVFERFAGFLLRDLHNPRRPVCLSDDPEAQEVEASYRGALRRCVEDLIKREGLDAAAMIAPPTLGEDEASARRYCPRCRSLYGEDSEACEDCGGVPLLAIPRISPA